MNKDKAKATSTRATKAAADGTHPPADIEAELIDADAPVEDEAIVGEVITDPEEQVEAIEPESEPQSEETAVAVVVVKAAKPAKAVKLTAEEKAAARATTKALTGIAANVHKEFGKGIDSQFAIGRLLSEARALLASNKEFGTWVAEQKFGLTQPVANRLMAGYEREDEVREFIRQRMESGGSDIGVTTAVERLTAGPSESVDQQTANRVQKLVSDDPLIVDGGFTAFVAAAGALDMSVLELGDLVEVAGIIQTLAGAYKAEKARR